MVQIIEVLLVAWATADWGKIYSMTVLRWDMLLARAHAKQIKTA